MPQQSSIFQMMLQFSISNCTAQKKKLVAKSSLSNPGVTLHPEQGFLISPNKDNGFAVIK